MQEMSADDPIIYFYASGGASTATTNVRYKMDKDAKPAMWSRMNMGPWQKLRFTFTESWFQSGHVGPGDVLEYRLYDDATMPGYVPDTVANELQPRSGAILAHVEIFGLLKFPIKTDWVRGGEKKPGGTYYLRQIATGSNVTINVRIEVSREKPVPDANEYVRFDKPDISMLALGKNQYELIMTPLRPGTDYYCLIRYSDVQGNWWLEEEKFTTLQRIVTVKGHHIEINDDGDPFADGEASFSFQFAQGTNSATFFLGHDDYKIYDGQSISLGSLPRLDTTDLTWPPQVAPCEKTFGPFAVHDDTPDVTVGANGTEYDGAFEPNEYAATAQLPVYCPTGIQEVVSDNASVVSVAATDPEDDFSFTLHYRYWVNYV